MVLKNICNKDFSDWVQGDSAYVSIQIPLTEPILPDDYIYARYSFKYTSSGSSRCEWASLYATYGRHRVGVISDPAPDVVYSANGVAVVGDYYEQASTSVLYVKAYDDIYDGLLPYFKEVMIFNISKLIETYPALKALSYEEIAKILDAILYTKSGETFTLTHEYLSLIDINMSSIHVLPIITY